MLLQSHACALLRQPHLRYGRAMTVGQVTSEGLCTECGTCAGICPHRAIEMHWSLEFGWRPQVYAQLCRDCGTCLDVCPGRGFDYSAGAWWRDTDAKVLASDFLGPWRSLWFGWATDHDVRYRAASGGLASAILLGALAQNLVDGAIVARPGRDNPLAIVPQVARSVAGVVAAQGSKYNMVPMNAALREILEQPGRYAVVGLPCHIQGLRLALRRDPRLRERVVFALGIFCGWSAQPRATALVARRYGIAAGDLAQVRYRGPGWPGGLRLTTKGGDVYQRPYPDYWDDDHAVLALTPSRCRQCPDGMAELADISVGDAWVRRFVGSSGVSDLVVRTAVGDALIERLGSEHLTLLAANESEILRSQQATHRLKRRVLRGRRWLRTLARRPVPHYSGLDMGATPRDVLAGLVDVTDEVVQRGFVTLRYHL